MTNTSPPKETSAITKVLLGCLTIYILATIVVSSLIRPPIDVSDMTAAEMNCRAFAEAQEIYHRTDYDGDGILEYAQSLTGNNSLRETTAGSGNLAMVDRTFGAAELSQSNPVPKAGYFFKVLKAQGPNVLGGAKSYLDDNGNMTKGYALAAVPAEYGKSGRNTVVIHSNGVIYQKDLGPDSLKIVKEMTEFNPDFPATHDHE